MTRIALLAALVALCACTEPAPPEKPSISYKTRAENASMRVEKEHRLSENETVRVVIVPGWPMGERCVLYTGPTSSAMACREVSPLRQ